MVSLHGLALLAILAGSSQRHGYPALAQAYQDAAHYYLPSNIYDNLPPGIETPAGGVPQPSQVPSPAQLRSSQRSTDKLLPGPDDTPRIDVTTPLFNAVYTPSSDLIMTWTHNGIEFPNNWTPQESLLDMITNNPNFSHSPLLTKDDMTNLAKIKLEDLKRGQLASIMKDSPIWLHCLRLVSESSDVAGKGQFPIQPKILFDPGYDLQKVSRMVMVGGGAGGQLTWTIPVAWPYEGEFEIRIPSLPSSNQTVVGKDMGTKSYTFWILRDDATRKANPVYTPSSVNDMQPAEKDANRHRALSIFLSVSAMILALILLGLGFMIGIYRRAPSVTSLATAGDSSPSPTSSVSTKADSQDFAKGRSHSLPPSLLTQGIHPWMRDGYPHQKQETGLLERAPGDEDAHSASTLSSTGRIPEDDTFVDLPLYDDQDYPPKVDSKRL
ncbi:hypothetical protein BGX34_006995 [Mortierella sp. NVP85]|nr:hypothetical protein BGX34_006995 [Mortierella sp. NVP85]